VIAAGPLVQRVPLYRGPQGEWVSQYDMHALKRVGLVKFDFLARKALTVMRRALELIGSHAQVSPGLVELPWDDKPAYDLLCRGRTAGIPHLETPAAREILLKWQPKHWHDLLVLMVLIRPTALESGLTERLLQARLHQEPEGPSIGDAEQKNDEDAQPLLFDVDLTRLIEQTTGSSMEQADLLRRQMVRRNVEEMDSLHEEFLAQAETNGCRRESAEARWAWLERAAPQVQNKSQTVGRALVVLQTAFLKARYPQQFMTALLNSELRQLDLLVDHVKACHAEGQTVLASDINLSGAEFTVESGGIRFGLAAVRQVSLAAAEAIVRARQERGPFRSLAELCAGVDQQVLGKRALEALIKAGALDSFRCPRKRLFEMLSEVFEQARRGQMGLFNRCDQEVLLLEKTQSTLEWDEATKLAHEKEALGFYLSGHPLSEFVYLLEKLAPGGTAQVSRLPDGSRGRVGGVIEEIKSISSRKNEPLHFLKLEDLEGTLAVVVFADTRVTPELGLEKGARVLVMGRVARADGRIRLVADEIVSLEEAAASKAVSVHLHLRVEGITPRELEKLRQIMSDYPGTCPISLHFYLGRFVEVVQRLSSAYTVRLDRQLEQRLREAFGERCLEVRYEEALSGGSATHEAEEGD
jgi:DNA polymerase-3 subunit alpha